MSLQKLDIFHVRNIHEQTILPSQTLNFIYGNNGSGKSALLEAIFLLGRAKSFRTATIKSVINFNQPHLVVSAEIIQTQNQLIHLGIRMDGKTVEMRKNQSPSQKRSDLAYALPLQIIHPKSYELLDAGAQIRREFLDWGIFHHENNFLPVWKNYKKILAHRNALLKSNSISQLKVWDKELVTYGTIVQQFRRAYIDKISPVLKATITKFLPLADIELNLLAGWDEKQSFEELLRKDLEKDIRDGFTHTGPHRGDFQVLINKKLAKDVVSRGQQKILVICLKLAQVELMYKEQDYFGCILFDDFAAELDIENRAKILLYLLDMRCQAFISATEVYGFGDLSGFNNYKMFHVEHGKITEVDVPHGTICN